MRIKLWPLVVLVLLLLVFDIYEAHGECAAVKLKVGEAVDQNCHVFTIKKEHGQRVIEYRGKREIVDCSKAKQDAAGGWWDYYPHIVSTRIWCSIKK